jgi:hypothetical protein
VFAFHHRDEPAKPGTLGEEGLRAGHFEPNGSRTPPALPQLTAPAREAGSLRGMGATHLGAAQPWGAEVFASAVARQCAAARARRPRLPARTSRAEPALLPSIIDRMGFAKEGSAMDTTVLTAHVPLPLSEKVDQIAARLDRSREWVVEQALTAWISQ